MEIFDAASGVILAGLIISWWALPAFGWLRSPRSRAALFCAVMVGWCVVRKSLNAAEALDLAAALLLISIGLCLGQSILVDHYWPVRALVLAAVVITASGAYLRAYRLDDIRVGGVESLQPDVRDVYLPSALRTGNPFASGVKSPLWSAMHAPFVSRMKDPHMGMRLLSWGFGVLMLPAVALVLGRLFEPIVGAIVAGSLALDPWLIDLCCQGLREECEVCFWMAILALLFATQGWATWWRVLGVAALGGLLLLLRNFAVVPLFAMLALAMIGQRWSLGQVLSGLLLPLLIVSPFYVNQYRRHGDPFYMEKRDARYHANLEFLSRPAPPNLRMPSVEEWEQDLYAGPPLSPIAYLLKYHSFGDFLSLQWRGLHAIVTGRPFHFQASGWMRWVCTAGLVASVLCPRRRFAVLFVLATAVGMRAHLEALGQLDQRLLLPVMVIWLACGWWLVANCVRVGGRFWLERSGRSSA